MAAGAAGAASAPSAAAARQHYSGLWIGESHPAAGSEHDVPVNPIKWSLSLCPGAGPVSAFGAGFFDDAGDIPGQPVLFFLLKGQFDPATLAIKITKTYESRNIPEELKVEYEGKLQILPDGQPALTGTWANVMEGTGGHFACRLEEP
eukprot:Tamp_13289.p3 GENE.Tamp_13289~~Tamp_13289.p3  ORF type:complete len:148 (+),score=28.62 Tamp_13289:191-634(+)